MIRHVKQVFFIAFFLGIFSASVHAEHDIHLSMAEIRFNEATSSFEVAIKIFIDDLELAIEKEEQVSGLKIGTEKEATNADAFIASYLAKHFTISVNGALLIPDYLGKEVTEDLLAVWCYVEFPQKGPAARSCILSNNILLEVYQDQRNIMDIKMNRSHKDYAILERGRNTWSYTYK